MKRDREYMTSKENERRKREHFIFIHSNAKKIEKVFPDVESIEIFYLNEHNCIFGNSKKEGTLTYTPQSEDVFVIDCLNPECTSFGYDLKNEIRTMIGEHKTELTGERNCEGQEAHDHPEQNCGGSLKYAIRIFYK